MIPKNKVTDMKGLKAYEEIKHTHKDKPTRLESKQCQRCRFDTAEQSLTDHLKNHSGKYKTRKVEGGPIIEVDLVELEVVRGSFDDCIGWTCSWR